MRLAIVSSFVLVPLAAGCAGIVRSEEVGRARTPAGLAVIVEIEGLAAERIHGVKASTAGEEPLLKRFEAFVFTDANGDGRFDPGETVHGRALAQVGVPSSFLEVHSIAFPYAPHDAALALAWSVDAGGEMLAGCWPLPKR